MTESAVPRPLVDIKNAVVRFAGDSGDGMQLTGTEFTREAALHGNDLATFPDYPAEIRAPAGTTAGVSGYQIQFAAHEVYSAGDQPDTLVAMNPAALKVHLPDLKRGGMLIVKKAPPLAEANLRAFKAGYNYGETIEALAPYSIQPARLKPGKYRNVTSNSALALGLIAAAQKAGLRMFY